jgi:hypothetical protein
MATTPPATPPAAPPESFFAKVWGWIKKETVVVEADLAKIIGPNLAGELETIGKNLLDGELGPLAVQAIADATDVATGTMSVSKAISSLITLAETDGKALSQAAALQVIALAQNALPVSSTAATTVKPVA